MTVEHDSEAFERIARHLKKSFDEDRIEISLIESLLVGVVAETKTIPDEILRIITASMVLQVVEKEYFAGLDEGTDAAGHWQTAYKVAQLGINLRCSDDTLESMAFYGADACIRSGGSPTNLIALMKRKGFASADYIEGSYLFHVERNFERAAKCLERTLSSKNFRVRNVRLLSRIYLRIGKPERALEALSYVEAPRLMRDTGLLVMKIRALRMARRRGEADLLEKELGNSDNEYGDLAFYKAAQAFGSGSYADVQRHIDVARLAPRSNKLTLRFLECASQVEQGINDGLSETCLLARAGGREADALQLEARAALFVGDWKSADTALSQIKRKDYFDTTVEIRVLEAKKKDPGFLFDPVAQADITQRYERCLQRIATGSDGWRN